jgi:hypothetical protein
MKRSCVVPAAEVAADRWQAHAGLSAAPHREMPDADDVHCAVRADHLFARDAVLEARLVDDARAGVRGEDAGDEIVAELGKGRSISVGGSGSGSGATPGRSAGIGLRHRQLRLEGRAADAPIDGPVMFDEVVKVS